MFEYMLRQSDQLKEAFERNELKLSGDEDNDLVFIKEQFVELPKSNQGDLDITARMSAEQLLESKTWIQDHDEGDYIHSTDIVHDAHE